jgi:hypothetical protein
MRNLIEPRYLSLWLQHTTLTRAPGKKRLRFEMNAVVHARILAQTALSYQTSKLMPSGVAFSAKIPDGFKTVSAIQEMKNEIGKVWLRSYCPG